MDREREYDAWIEAERVDSRDEGGAYCSGGRAGYGSMIRTSWREEVPNPIHQHCILIEFGLTFEGNIDRRLEILDSHLIIPILLYPTGSGSTKIRDVRFHIFIKIHQFGRGTPPSNRNRTSPRSGPGTRDFLSLTRCRRWFDCRWGCWSSQ